MLDLKYRPKKLSEVLGNPGPKSVLSARIKNKSLTSKSYLLQGPKGSGKTSVARIISKSIYCENVSEDGPCGLCSSCTESDQGILMSCEEFDAATQGTVDKMRQIVEELDYGFVDGKPRVLILDEAQRLSKASQDALLKSIEDRRIVCILCTTEPQLIRSAIRSRCEEFSIHYPSHKELSEKLSYVCGQEKINLDQDSIDFICRKSGNCSRIALGLLETISELGISDSDQIRSYIGDDPSFTLIQVLKRFQDKMSSESVSKFSDMIRTHGSDVVHELLLTLNLDLKKKSLGIPSQFPCDTSEISCYEQLDQIAKLLIERDKLSPIELEYIVLDQFSESVKNHPVVNTPAEPYKIQSKKAVIDVKIEKKIEKTRQIEIDGITFSSDEKLTSMDSQFTTAATPEIQEESTPVVTPVKLDKEKIPMSTKEFSREFRERFGRFK